MSSQKQKECDAGRQLLCNNMAGAYIRAKNNFNRELNKLGPIRANLQSQANSLNRDGCGTKYPVPQRYEPGNY